MKQSSARGRASRHDRRGSRRHRLRVSPRRPHPRQARRAAGRGPGAAGARPARPSRRPRRPRRAGRSAGERSRQRDRRLRSQAADTGADAGGRGQEDLAAARVQARAGAHRSAHRGVRADRLRRQRPDVRPRAAQLHAGRGRGRRARSDRPHLDARGSRQRRQVRDAQGLRRQAGVSALRHALRRQRGPDDGVECRRGVEVHRHQQRRRRRQEGAVRHRLRPARQRRAPAVGPVLGHGQLVLQHRQRVPRAPLAERRAGAAGAHRRQQRAVGRGDGQLRQGVLPGRRQRHARVLPAAGPLRQLQRARSVRGEPEHHVGRAGAHRRHAGRPAGGAAARRLAQPHHRRRRQRRLPRPSPAEGHGRRLLLR